ncbi:Avirulence (Avh) protein [Phytophthora megakarya]|uniref:RxLR effector protein n=1 Tax=Phytophthora megakarya TaxID=4795 RepID=A0A225V528_9STRA|nr:Avirulence (Avh) protein [Phytophthora megakarya]
MRIHYTVLLGVAAVVASTNATLTKDVTSDHSVLGDASTSRFLRIHSATEDDEEKAFGVKSIPGVSKISNFLTSKKLAKYLKTDKDVDDVFVKLKLNAPNKNVFENPKFLRWSQYVDSLNRKNVNKEPKSMIPTLLRYYDGVQLSTMLEAATKVDSTHVVAKKLQGEQMDVTKGCQQTLRQSISCSTDIHWKREGVTADQLFSLYKLDILGDGVKNLLAKPGVNVFIRYADEFNSGERMTLFEKLQKIYSDTVLSQLLSAGMKDPKTKTLATELQTQQMNYWLDLRQPPENVFKFLALDKGAEHLLSNAQFYTWVHYLNHYNANNEITTELTLFGALKTHYSDDGIVAMLRTANPHSVRETVVKNYLENALLDKWAKAKKPVGDVVAALGDTRAYKNAVLWDYSNKIKAMGSS